MTREAYKDALFLLRIPLTIVLDISLYLGMHSNPFLRKHYFWLPIADEHVAVLVRLTQSRV